MHAASRGSSALQQAPGLHPVSCVLGETVTDLTIEMSNPRERVLSTCVDRGVRSRPLRCDERGGTATNRLRRSTRCGEHPRPALARVGNSSTRASCHPSRVLATNVDPWLCKDLARALGAALRAAARIHSQRHCSMAAQMAAAGRAQTTNFHRGALRPAFPEPPRCS